MPTDMDVLAKVSTDLASGHLYPELSTRGQWATRLKRKRKKGDETLNLRFKTVLSDPLLS